MPHEVSSLAYVNNDQLAKTGVPWHGIGTSYDTWLTDEQAIDEIGWDVEVQPQYRRNASGLYVETPKSNAIVRTDIDKYLGTVGDIYVPFQNRELIELGSILVDDYGAKWDTVGSLKDDTLVFATLRLDVASLPGRGLAALDDSEYFTWLLLSNWHNGNGGLSGQSVKVRTVCANTYQAGTATGKPGWTVRHTGNVTEKAIEAHRTIGLITEREKQFNEWSTKLAESALAVEEFDKVAADLFPIDRTKGDLAKSRQESRRAGVKANWLNTSTVPEGLRFTRWGALNGITEWAEHVNEERPDSRTSSNERAILSNLFGGVTQTTRANAQRLLTVGV